MSDKNQYWFLEDFDLLKRMSSEAIKSVEEGILVRTLKKDTILRFPKMLNRYVYFLKEGIIEIASNNKGKEFIKYLLKPGSLFGEIPLLNGAENPEDYAVAVEDSVVCFIDAEKLKQWMLRNEDLRIKINQHISARIRKVENRLLSMIFKNVRSRIGEFIVEFAKEFGKTGNHGYEVRNFLTHEDIAKLTATSRQTVSRILNELRDKKMIEYNEELFHIPFDSQLLREHQTLPE